MNDSTPFSVEIKDHVAWLTLCRPERRNAMGMAFFRELTDHFRRFDKDDAVRAVVIRAEGPTFTAGLDLMEAGGLLAGKGADDREKLKETILDLQESNNAIERCRTIKKVAAGKQLFVNYGKEWWTSRDLKPE